MQPDIESLISLIKLQAQTFLLDVQEFYPFGTAINKRNELVPFSVYFSQEFPKSEDVIMELEKAINTSLTSGEKTISTITIDIALTENNVRFDAIEIRFFELNKAMYSRYFKYQIHNEQVDFFEV